MRWGTFFRRPPSANCLSTFWLLHDEISGKFCGRKRFIKAIFFCTGRVAAGDGRFNSNTEVNINTEVKSIPVTKKGVYFAFRDQGACISLLAIKVSLSKIKVCDQSQFRDLLIFWGIKCIPFVMVNLTQPLYQSETIKNFCMY